MATNDCRVSNDGTGPAAALSCARGTLKCSGPQMGSGCKDQYKRNAHQLMTCQPTGVEPFPPTNNRILVVDDNPGIHDDFRKLLGGRCMPQAELIAAEAA